MPLGDAYSGARAGRPWAPPAAADPTQPRRYFQSCRPAARPTPHAASAGAAAEGADEPAAALDADGGDLAVWLLDGGRMRARLRDILAFSLPVVLVPLADPLLGLVDSVCLVRPRPPRQLSAVLRLRGA